MGSADVLAASAVSGCIGGRDPLPQHGWRGPEQIGFVGQRTAAKSFNDKTLTNKTSDTNKTSTKKTFDQRRTSGAMSAYSSLADAAALTARRRAAPRSGRRPRHRHRRVRPAPSGDVDRVDGDGGSARRTGAEQRRSSVHGDRLVHRCRSGDAATGAALPEVAPASRVRRCRRWLRPNRCRHRRAAGRGSAGRRPEGRLEQQTAGGGSTRPMRRGPMPTSIRLRCSAAASGCNPRRPARRRARCRSAHRAAARRHDCEHLLGAADRLGGSS